MSTESQNLKHLFSDYYTPDEPGDAARKEILKRELYCTPYEFGDDHPGWVVCVGGTPAKGTLVIKGRMPGAASYILSVKANRIDLESEQTIVKQFFEAELRGKTEPHVVY